MKKRLLSLLLALVMCLSLGVPAWAEVLEDATFPENISQSNDTATSYLIQSQGIDEYESIVSEADFWYDNLPTYSGTTLEKTIDVSALSDVNSASRSMSSSLSRSTASVQIARLSASKENNFPVGTPPNCPNRFQSIPLMGQYTPMHTVLSMKTANS